MNAKIRNAIKLPVTNPVPSPLTSSDISDLRRAENEGGVRWVPQRPDAPIAWPAAAAPGLASGEDCDSALAKVTTSSERRCSCNGGSSP